MNSQLPPHDEDTEKALLGSLLIDPSAIPDVGAHVKPEDFYRIEHTLIYAAILETGQHADLLTVAKELERHNQLASVGGSAYLAELTATVPTALNVEKYAEIVAGYAIRRRLLGTLSIIGKDAWDESKDPATLPEMAMDLLSSIIRDKTPDELTLHEVIDVYTRERAIEYDHQGKPVGISSGLSPLDALTGGWRPGQLITIAGLTGSGKTTLALNFALNAARCSIPTAIFTLEMTEVEIMRKLVAKSTSIDTSHAQSAVRTADDYAEELEHAKKIGNFPLHIRYLPGASVQRIALECERVKALGTKLIFIDYLQIITTQISNGSTLAYELGNITRQLKRLAGQLGATIFVGSQLNRSAANDEPQLHHLKDSGSIEQDSDIVIMLHAQNPDHDPNLLKLYIRKNRGGAIGDTEVYFDKPTCRFGVVAHRTKQDATDPNGFAVKH
jgi:replicative DNA helicase